MSLFAPKPPESYVIRDEFGMTRVLVVSKKYISEFGFYAPTIRIESLKSSLRDGEKTT